MSTSPKTLRTRNMAAAKRSLKLIEQAVAEHRKALDAGEVPDNGFAVYVIKYEHARVCLGLLDALDGDAPAEEDAVEVQAREDLGVLVRLVAAVTGPDALQGDTPLGRVAAVAFPDGLPAPAGQEQES